MRPEHHQGYILLRNKERPVAVTVDCTNIIDNDYD